MIKWIIKIGVIGVLLVLGFIGAVSYLVSQPNKTIAPILLPALNQQIKGELAVNGDIQFSVWRNFPQLTLELHDIHLKNQQQHTLCQLSTLSFTTNLSALWNKNYTVNAVILEDGLVNLVIDKNGKHNWSVFTSSGAETPIDFKIEAAELKQIDFNFEDQRSALKAASALNFNMAGSFTNQTFYLELLGKADIKNLEHQNQVLLQNMPIQFDVGGLVNTQKNQYKLDKAALDMNGTQLQLTGKFQQESNQGFYTDIKAEATGSNLNDVLLLLPLKWKQQLSNIDAKGAFDVEFSSKGYVDAKQLPDIQLNAKIEQADVQMEQLPQSVEIENVSFNYDSRKSTIGVDAKITYNKKAVQTSIAIFDIEQPNIEIDVTGDIDLSLFNGFVTNDSIVVSGFLTVNQLQTVLLVKDGTIDHYDFLGSAALQSANFKRKALTIENISGQLDFNKALISANQLKLTLAGSAFNFSGTLGNLIPYAIDLTKSKPIKTALIIEGEASTPELDLEQMLQQLGANPNNAITTRDALHFKGELFANIGLLKHQNLELEQISGSAKFAGNHSLAYDLICKSAFQGAVQGTGLIRFLPNDVIQYRGAHDVQSVEIQELFKGFDDFDQQTLTQQNLSGTLSGKVNHQVRWQNQSFVTDSAQMNADVVIEKGVLKDFKPLEKLDQYIDLEALKNIEFARLENQITIKNRKISIPSMQINSSALNIGLEGWHRFNNTVDYHFVIRLRDYLSRKFASKRRAENFEQTADGGMRLFIHMFGPIDNPTINYDKTAVKAQIKAGFKAEKEELKALFRGDEPKQSSEEQDHFDTETEPEFIDFEEE